MDGPAPRRQLTGLRAKRIADVTVAVLAILALAPLLLLIAASVKLESRGPVLFRQLRRGQAGSTFFLLKFRTMYPEVQTFSDVQSEAPGPLFTLYRDPRVTRVGRFLRRTFFDDLPQLVNVLKGDMSLVGPRPFVLQEDAVVSADAPERLTVRPGMTGLWQVSGRNHLPYDDLIYLDQFYVHNWSLQLDLKIIARTVPVVLRGDGF